MNASTQSSIQKLLAAALPSAMAWKTFTPSRQPERYPVAGFATASRVWTALASLMLLLSFGDGSAAPFAKYFDFTQPDGTPLKLWGEGDEFQAVFETVEGYTVVFEPEQRAYFYAAKAADGKNLVSTGTLAHRAAPAGLVLHERMDQETLQAATRARQQRWDADTGMSQRWRQLKAMRLSARPDHGEVSAQPDPPAWPTVGTKIGLTLLIDFPDEPGTISQAQVDAFCNGDNYTGFGNNGSVKNYFSDVSAGKLLYSNIVTIYVRTTRPKSYSTTSPKTALCKPNCSWPTRSPSCRPGPIIPRRSCPRSIPSPPTTTTR